MLRKLVYAALGVVYFGLAAASAQADVDFPYKAVVAVEETYVRSGPGSSYYPTDKMKRGDEVEVYRHDADGWCAIRPPEGSFSWVSERNIRVVQDNIAVVLDEETPSCIGSRFSDIRDAKSVRLHRDEQVEILEKVQPQGNSTTAWYKIAPPSGEFRWVPMKAILPKIDDVKITPPAVAPLIAAGAKDPDTTPVKEKSERAEAPTPLAGKNLPGERTRMPEEFKNALQQLELDLSMMIVEEPNVWSFSTLKPKAETLFDSADTALERGQARALLSKIERFEDIKQRYEKLGTMYDETTRSGRMIAGLRESVDRAKNYIGDNKYDATGLLQPINATKPGDPRYALVDTTGNIRAYISPAPGVNLHNYVGRQVGVTGSRGYSADSKVDNITARYISPLGSTGTTMR